MLCCVSKPPTEYQVTQTILSKNLSSLSCVKTPELNIYQDDSSILLPCTNCNRTFKPDSLEKHSRICQMTAAKRRRPFDSSKQRIRGTELEDFHSKTTKKKSSNDEKKRVNSSWKQTHDDFLKSIKAAKEYSVDTSVRPSTTTTVPVNGTDAKTPPRSSTDKGVCPTCNRKFGIKAYDRHIAWCKERRDKTPSSPATNIAKERLDARMKYRAPGLKNRKMTNREKYSSNQDKNREVCPANPVIESKLPITTEKKTEPASIKKPKTPDPPKLNQKSCILPSFPVENSNESLTNCWRIQRKNKPVINKQLMDPAVEQLNNSMEENISDDEYLKRVNLETYSGNFENSWIERSNSDRLKIESNELENLELASLLSSPSVDDHNSDDKTVPMTNVSIPFSQNFTSDSLESNKSKYIRRKLRKKINHFRNSTDFLVSSIEITNDEDNFTTEILKFPPRESFASENKRNFVQFKASHLFPDILQKPQTSQYFPDQHVSFWKKLPKNTVNRSTATFPFLPSIYPINLRGISQDFDSYILAERQLSDLLSDTCSDHSFPDSPSSYSVYSSAFAKYPIRTVDNKQHSAASVISFDGFSSDSTETNSLTREISSFVDESFDKSVNKHQLSRRIIIDKTKALGADENAFDYSTTSKNNWKSSKIICPNVSRTIQSATNDNNNTQNNNYINLNSSNLSLSSAVSSSDVDIVKQSAFDQLVNSFNQNFTNMMKCDSSNQQPTRPVIISDDDASPSDHFKNNKISNDSAYSSLNRKYQASSAKVTAQSPENDAAIKLSKFCYECGTKFSKAAKFCCECGRQRLIL